MSLTDIKTPPDKSTVPDTKSPPSVTTFWIEPSGGENHPTKLTLIYNEDGITKRRHEEFHAADTYPEAPRLGNLIQGWCEDMKTKAPQIRIEIESNYSGEANAKQMEKALSPLKEHYPVVFSLWFVGKP